jgi:hypothetical protein
MTMMRTPRSTARSREPLRRSRESKESPAEAGATPQSGSRLLVTTLPPRSRGIRLHADIEAASHPIQVYANINAFLARLGTTAAGREITLDELDEFVATTVAGALKDSFEISRAV